MDVVKTQGERLAVSNQLFALIAQFRKETVETGDSK